MKIIPAIDLIGGKCVRLEQGDYNRQTNYADDPLEMAKAFEGAGVRRLHLVDLDGAKAGEVINLPVLERIAAHTSLQIDFGGGVKTAADVQRVLNAGAQWVAVGSMAVKSGTVVEKWFEEFGAARFFIGADVRGTQLAVSGWLEQTEVEIVPFIQRYLQLGVNEFFCTDISRDGLLQGPSTALYEMLLRECSGLRLTASGGVSGMNDLAELQRAGCTAAIVGKAIYEGRITLHDLQQWNSVNETRV
ncbi:MAG: 1-(5-phosphoribosyl)-5-[(5-phosphoribosylamino)methylideneamino]imidazole-4-carboxamide isomerase [Bacteroidia bacterium]|jgi:phosphoribosylformimino-5-aminoimidazole carboxamide ribotide isomerase|nr:1-(5-phosphoribosyl)-5-[(5-phosphoribosylamino)methylideneamino]imidazole-4-carboxamide isomerase [Bacteroidia bacterium]